MDPSVLLKQRGVRWDDPLDDYTKLRSLRDLMDQRRLREQQYQMHQLAMQKTQQEMADAQQYRQALSGGIPVGATLSAMVERFGPKGADLYRDLRQAQSAESARQTAELTQQQKQADIKSEQQKREANLYAAVLQLPPEQRQDYWEKNVGGGIPIDLPPTAADEQAQYALAYGGEAAEKRKEERRKAASAAVTEPYQRQKIIDEAEGVRSKRTGVKLFKSSTPEEWARNIQELPETERAQWIGVPFTPANRYKALTLGQTPTEILTQERQAVPDNLDKLNWWLAQPDRTEEEKRVGLAAKQGMIESKVATQQDRLLNPAEFAQALELTTAKSKALQEGKPPSQGEELLAGYAARVAMANKGFETLTMGGKEMAWNKWTPDFLNTEAGKNFAQDERNFINAILRRESGAVISPGEFTSAREQYIPQPNDPPSTLEKKRRNRLIVQQSLIRGSGRAYVDPDELLRQAGVDPATLAPGAPPPAAAPGTIPSPMLSGGKPSPATSEGAKAGGREKWVRDSKGVLRKAGN